MRSVTFCNEICNTFSTKSITLSCKLVNRMGRPVYDGVSVHPPAVAFLYNVSLLYRMERPVYDEVSVHPNPVAFLLVHDAVSIFLCQKRNY
jgi:hypothetical protein